MRHFCYNVYINLKESASWLKLSEEQLNSLNHDALVIIAASLQDQLISVSEQLDKANAQLADNNKKIDFLAEQIRIMNQRKFGKAANYAQTECQFRYCGTAIPFLTVRSTAR